MSLRKHIKSLIEERLRPSVERIGNKKSLKEWGDVATAVLNNTPVYPDGATHFPTFQRPTTPEEIGMLSNREYGLNKDQQDDELYLNRDTVDPSPILPGNDGATIIPYHDYGPK